jgi:phage shock protein PspC (stress-responsive transcriptional regulator)
MSSYDASADSASTGTTPPSDPPPTTSPAGGTPLRPPLQRSRERRVIAGVCGGLGEYFGVDPVLFRVVLVVLTLFGGWGLLLYLLGWLLIPDGPTTASDGSVQPSRNHGVLWILGAVVLVLLVLPVALGLARALFWQLGGYHDMSMPMMFGTSPLHLFWPGAGSLLLLLGAGAVIWWLVRRDNDHVSTPAASAPPVRAAGVPTTAMPPAVESTVYPDAAPPSAAHPSTTTSPTIAFAPASTWVDPGVGAPPPGAPRPRRTRSVLGPLTVSLAAVVVGVLLALRVTDHSVPVAVVLASALAVVALGLLIGTWLGRSRGLIALGVLLSISTAIAAALPPVTITGGLGSRQWNPQTAKVAAVQSPYRLGIGSAELDLTNVYDPLGTTVDVSASVGVGNLVVYVPKRGYDVTVFANAGLGSIAWQGDNGVQTEASGRNVTRMFTAGSRDAGVAMVVDVSIDMGRILIVPTGGTR